MVHFQYRPVYSLFPVTSPLTLLRAGWSSNAPGRSRLVRVLIGAFLAVHGFVIAVAPIADAMAGHADGVVAHWEDAQDTSCPPQHDQSACQLCQVVSASFGGASSERVGPARLARAEAPLPRDAGLGAYPSALRGSPHPRGPPRA